MSTPFKTLGAAICFYNERNPARAKSVNFFEPDRGCATFKGADFSGDSEADIYASVRYAITYALDGKTQDEARAWEMRNIGAREGHWAIESIAREFRKSARTISRYLKIINDDLENELRRRELLPPIQH